MTRGVRRLVSAAVASAVVLLANAPGAPAAPTPRSSPATGTIRVATYNICNINCRKGRFSWGHRRGALVNAVSSAHPDVLALQEANTQVWHGTRHIDDVRQLLGGIGYQIASTDYAGCTAGCTRGAHIFFDPRRMRPASMPGSQVAVAGMTGMSLIAGTGFGDVQDRAVSWAFLSPVGSTRTTLYVSVHLPTQKTALAEQLRVAVASGLRGWADGLIRGSGLDDVELVIAGDLNSYQRRQPNGAQQVLSDSGLVDGYSAPVRVNSNVGTVNYTPKTMKYKGFPPKPYFYRANTTRIDYVFSTVAPLRHEVVLTLTGSGRFDNAYRASDHNMVMVDLPLA